MIGKKLLASALALAMSISTFTFAINYRNANLFGVSSLMASAATSTDSFVWTELSDGTMEIYNYIGDDTEVIIPSTVNGKPVTSIGYNAFSVGSGSKPGTVTSVTSVKIPNTVTKISGRAFYNTKITHIDIPDSVTTIDGYAFSCCSELVSINIPNSVTSFGKSSGRVFKSCNKLKSISLPDSFEYCNLQECFYLCDSLETVRLPGNISLLNRYAFRDCPNLKTVYIPESYTEIQNYTFHNVNPDLVIKYEGSQEEWNNIKINAQGNTLVAQNSVEIKYDQPIPAHVYDDYDYSSDDFIEESKEESSEESSEEESSSESSSDIESSSEIESSSQTEAIETEEIIWTGKQENNAQLKIAVNLKDWETVSAKVILQGKSSSVRAQIDANLTTEPYYLAILPSKDIGNVTTYVCEISDENKDLIKEINFQIDDVITQVSLVGTKKGGSVHTHKYTSTVTKAATCTEDGVKTFTCTCGDSYTEVIKATGHKFGAWTTTKAATCEADGVQTRTCANCDEKETRAIAATGHKYVDTVVPPTTTEQGYTEHKCSACGHSYKDSYTDPVHEETTLPGKINGQKNSISGAIRFIAEVSLDDIYAVDDAYMEIKVGNNTTKYNITSSYEGYKSGSKMVSAPEGKNYIISKSFTNLKKGDSVTISIYFDTYDLPLTRTIKIP